jgi:hypothetical protein
MQVNISAQPTRSIVNPPRTTVHVSDSSQDQTSPHLELQHDQLVHSPLVGDEDVRPAPVRLQRDGLEQFAQVPNHGDPNDSSNKFLILNLMCRSPK